MLSINTRDIEHFLEKNALHTRPNAGLGLWLIFLLPTAVIFSTLSNPIVTTSMYKLSSIFSLGLIFSSVIFILQAVQNSRLKSCSFLQIVNCGIIGVLFKICLHRGLLFSAFSAIFSTMLYHKMYTKALKKLSYCFSIGEAAVFSQSYCLLLYFTLINIFDKFSKPASGVVQMSTLTIQLGLLGVSLIVLLVYKFRISSPLKFYATTVSILGLVVLLPLQILLRINPLLWILSLFWEDLQQNRVITYWIIFSIGAVIAVYRRVTKAQKASTAGRKIFHFLVVAVFIPGLLYNCALLYLASGVVLGIFFMLELLRVLNMPPLAQSLQNGLIIFGDGKDVGVIAFTPMYLLAGCSLPLWIHPAPCDVTNSAIFNLLPLLSGVLTTGIGDTAASIVGSKFGRHHWKGSEKSLEGTLACIASQLLAIFLFSYFGSVKLNVVDDYIKVVTAVVVTSMIEAKTDQIDNLVLPFIMYTICVMSFS